MIQSPVGHRRLLFIINTLSSPSAVCLCVCLVFLNSNVFLFLLFWLMFCNDVKTALSCLAFWYGMLCFAFCCFSFMFCCVFCYSLVCVSLLWLYLKMWIHLFWMEKLNCKTFKRYYRAQSHWAIQSSLKPEPDDPPRSFRLSRSWPAFPNPTSTWTWGVKTNRTFTIRIMARSRPVVLDLCDSKAIHRRQRYSKAPWLPFVCDLLDKD